MRRTPLCDSSSRPLVAKPKTLNERCGLDCEITHSFTRLLLLLPSPCLSLQLTLKKNKSQNNKQRLGALMDELNALRAALGEKDLLTMRSQTELRELGAREQGSRVQLLHSPDQYTNTRVMSIWTIWPNVCLLLQRWRTTR